MVDMIAKRLPPNPKRDKVDSRAKMNMIRRKEIDSPIPMAMYSTGRIDVDAPYCNNYLSPNPPDLAGLILKK